jgi:NifB/MoaA-like Fe-S oxidoreductase
MRIFEALSEACMDNMKQTKLDIIAWVVAETDVNAVKRLSMTVEDITYERASETKVIGYRVNGTKVIKSQFIRCIQQDEQGLANGEYMSLQSLDKLSENW